MRVSTSSVVALPGTDPALSPGDGASGECAGEPVALASPGGCGAASSDAALVAKAAASTSIGDKEENLGFIQPLIMSRSLSRLRALDAGGGIFIAKEHDLNRRYDNQEDDRTNEHPTHNDRRERLLYLTADAGRNRRGQKADAG